MSLLFTRPFVWAFLVYVVPTVASAQWGGMGWYWPPPPTPVPAFYPKPGEAKPIPPPPETAVLNDVERNIFAALDKTEDWDLAPMTIAQLALEMNKRLACRVEKSALEEVGLSADLRLEAFRGKQIRASWMLTHLLREGDLAWTIRDGELVITTPEDAEDSLRLLVLPVVDLIGTPGIGREGYDYDTLVNLLTSTVRPDTWPGTNGAVGLFSGALVFEQDWRIGEEIERLLEAIRRMRKVETDPSEVKVPWYGRHFDGNSRWKHDERVTLKIDDIPLNELVQKLSQQTSTPIRVDTRSFSAEEVDMGIEVDFAASDDLLLTALRRSLKPHNLKVVYSHPYFVVTTEFGANAFSEIRVYPIHDLVDLPSERASTDFIPLGYAGMDEIVWQVTVNIMPSSWDAMGGEGAIEEFFNPPTLVVNHSLETHKRIEDLLARLREVRAIERESAKAAVCSEDVPHVAVYWLADRVPVDKTIELIQQLVPEVEEEQGTNRRPIYMKAFGHGILVCHDKSVHYRIGSLLSSLGLQRVPAVVPSGSESTGFLGRDVPR